MNSPLPAAQFCSGIGQFHSPNNTRNPQPYQTITLAEIEAMASNPPSVEKPAARWVINSTLLSRVHSEQREHGQFWALWADIDKNSIGFDGVVKTAQLLFMGLKFIAYTTRSATFENQKCRVIFPLAGLSPGMTYPTLQKILNDRLELVGIIPDRANERVGQVCYLPNRGDYYQYHIEPGRPLDWQTDFATEIAAEQSRLKAAERALAERREQSRLKAAERMATGTLSPIDAYNAAYAIEDCLLEYGYQECGSRWLSPHSESGNPGVTVKDGKWLSNHESDRQTVGTFGDAFDLFTFYEHGGDRTAALKAAGSMFMVGDVSLTTANQRRYMEGRAAEIFGQAPAVLPGGEIEGRQAYRLTELGNAERFRDQYCETVRYVSAWKKWILYDGTRWKVGADDKIRVKAHDTAKTLYAEAAQTTDNDMAQKIAKWAAQSCKSSSISALLKEAAALLSVDVAVLDADPWLLNCRNCTIDLKTGNARPHNIGDWITKLIPVDFDPQATAPRFEQVLRVCFAGNQDLIGFVQRFAGYSATGSTREQCIFIWWGGGANGKSTILNALAEALGDYAQTTRPETLMVKYGDGIPSDLAKLKGARLVTAAEAEDGHRLAESQIKQLTGGEKIQARALYQDWFEFTPEFKIILCTNHRPVIRGEDFAIWRRIRLVPFNVTIPEGDRDKDLPEKLRTELPGILAWIVKGAEEWLASGLGNPAEVEAATEDYRSEQSVISNFLDSCCVVKSGAQVEGSLLFQIFDRWRTLEGLRKITQTKFGRMLAVLGFEKSRCTSGRVLYGGVGLPNPSDPSVLFGEKRQ